MTVDLPRELKERFGHLRRHLWRVETGLALWLAVLGVFVSYFLLFMSDRLWDTPSLLRLAIFLAGLLLGGIALGRWAWRWILKPRNLLDYSNLVQARFRKLGDRLLGIVELAEASRRPDGFSPALYRAAIDQVAGDALRYEFRDAVEDRWRRKVYGLVAVMMILIAGAGVAVPGAARNALARWWRPLAQIERYTLVRFEGLPEDQIVVRGEPFELQGRVGYASFWRPSKVVGWFAGQRKRESAVQGKSFTLALPPRFVRGTLFLRTGDAKGTMTIRPFERPRLESISAEIELPDYLHYPNETVLLEQPVVIGVEGSRARFLGKVSRKLREATIEFPPRPPARVEIDGRQFQSAFVPLDGLLNAEVRWRDELGMKGGDPWRFEVRTHKDFAPTLDFPELPRETAILETEVLGLRMVARDDYGVNRLGVNWTTGDGQGPTEELLEREFRDQAVNRRQKALSVSFYMSPNLYGIAPGSTIELTGFATDFFPKRAPAETPVYRVHVVSSIEHAEMVRLRLEGLLTGLEDISRLEDKIAAATESLLEKVEKGDPVVAKRLDDSIADQAMNASELQRMAGEGLKTLMEAMRNPAFRDSMVQEWSGILSEMERLAQQKMRSANQSLSQAKQGPGGRAGKLAEAHQTEKEILESLEQLQRHANRDLDQLQALTLAERLRSIGRSLSEVETKLIGKAPATIGLRPDELPPRLQAFNQKMADQEGEAKDHTMALRDEISRFFERTQRENYGAVSKEMESQRVVNSLESVDELISRNIGIEASDHLGRWSQRFYQWAKKIEPPEADGGGGGKGGGGDKNALNLTKQLAALLRLREGELNLRNQTRLVDRFREEAERHRAESRKLADRQDGLHERAEAVAGKIPMRELEGVLGEVRSGMKGAAEGLEAAKTGKPTVHLESQSIDALTDAINLINEQARRKSSSSSSAARQMAFMMKMMALQGNMAMGTNPAGGGNPTGGDTQRTQKGLAGDASGAKDENRSVSRASGRMDNLPTEFRDMMEFYFQGLEGIDLKAAQGSPSPSEEASPTGQDPGGL